MITSLQKKEDAQKNERLMFHYFLYQFFSWVFNFFANPLILFFLEALDFRIDCENE